MTLEQREFELHGPLIRGYFSTENITVLCGPGLAESLDAEELQMWQADWKLHED